MNCPWCESKMESMYLEGFKVCVRCKLGFDVGSRGERNGPVWSCDGDLRSLMVYTGPGRWEEIADGLLIVKRERTNAG